MTRLTDRADVVFRIVRARIRNVGETTIEELELSDERTVLAPTDFLREAPPTRTHALQAVVLHPGEPLSEALYRLVRAEDVVWVGAYEAYMLGSCLTAQEAPSHLSPSSRWAHPEAR